MGCFGSNELTVEQAIQESEEQMELKKLNMEELQNAFFNNSINDILTYDGLKNSLKNLDLQYLHYKQEEKMQQQFMLLHQILFCYSDNLPEIQDFEDVQNKQEIKYNFHQLMTILYLNSDNNDNEKLQGLLHLHIQDFNQKIKKDNVSNIITKIFASILPYTFKLIQMNKLLTQGENDENVNYDEYFQRFQKVFDVKTNRLAIRISKKASQLQLKKQKKELDKTNSQDNLKSILLDEGFEGTDISIETLHDVIKIIAKKYSVDLFTPAGIRKLTMPFLHELDIEDKLREIEIEERIDLSHQDLKKKEELEVSGNKVVTKDDNQEVDNKVTSVLDELNIDADENNLLLKGAEYENQNTGEDVDDKSEKSQESEKSQKSKSIENSKSNENNETDSQKSGTDQNSQKN